MKALVLGLGNRMYGDDGFGSCLAEFLSKQKIENVDVKDGDYMGLGLLGWLEGYDLVIFIDAANPETVKNEIELLKIDPSKATVEEVSELVTDAHKVGPVQLAALAKKSGIFDGEAFLVALRAEKVCWPCSMRDEAMKLAPKAIELINKVLSSRGFKTFSSEGVVQWIKENCSEYY
ncbi:hydrogenase maturation protease [Ignicoccus pacificus DSM 13166]|uniref:Hydrogenase maturation protease n=1 Tax=Ignicoccus pacificus DSM 13166 TaxID=940294 RepID=A0A977KAJ8_9CREN|nr:hydrogenase maturation protease [Ignicoccus pacificus DSM 13166]